MHSALYVSVLAALPSKGMQGSGLSPCTMLWQNEPPKNRIQRRETLLGLYDQQQSVTQVRTALDHPGKTGASCAAPSTQSRAGQHHETPWTGSTEEYHNSEQCCERITSWIFAGAEELGWGKHSAPPPPAALSWLDVTAMQGFVPHKHCSGVEAAQQDDSDPVLFPCPAVLYLSLQDPTSLCRAFPTQLGPPGLWATLAPYLFSVALLSSGTFLESRRCIAVEGKGRKGELSPYRLLPAVTVPQW